MTNNRTDAWKTDVNLLSLLGFGVKKNVTTENHFFKIFFNIIIITIIIINN